MAKADIESARRMAQSLCDGGFIAQPPAEMLSEALEWTIAQLQ